MPDLDMLIHAWQSHLDLNRSFMEPSIIYFIEQTIIALKELKELKGGAK